MLSYGYICMCAERNEPLVPCWSFPDAGTTVSRLPRGLGDIRVEGAGKNGRENYAATRIAQCINNNRAGREEAGAQRMKVAVDLSAGCEYKKERRRKTQSYAAGRRGWTERGRDGT